jgi:A/G-specific adenine glycosylase
MDPMNLPAGPDFIRKQLTAWFMDHRRQLPWRETSDPYRIWVSEVMLQQTRVDTVIPYYRRFMGRFSDVQSLARAELQAVLKAWEGLGYYARARNLHRAARMVMEEGRGEIPREMESFRRLPGVGSYIAAAVLSIAFGKAHAVVDGNVKRVLARLFRIESPIALPETIRQVQSLADSLLDRSDPGSFNQALMELGALVCTPKDPECGCCPVSTVCRTGRTGEAAAYPVREKKRPVPVLHQVAGVVFKNGKTLIVCRPAQGLLGGLWEFPCGEKNGEAPEAACVRVVRECSGLIVRTDDHLTRVKHTFTHLKTVTDVFSCTWISGRTRLQGYREHRWVGVGELERFPFSRAARKWFADL